MGAALRAGARAAARGRHPDAGRPRCRRPRLHRAALALAAGHRGARAVAAPSDGGRGPAHGLTTAYQAPRACRLPAGANLSTGVQTMLAMNYRGPYRVRAVHKGEPEIEHPG